MSTHSRSLVTVASAETAPLTRLNAKRAFDCTLAAIGLLISAPVSGLIATAVKLEDGGPVFFPQERVGLNGRIFRALKFRSMVPDAERRTGPIQAAEHDPRITAVGRFLRATAMDELPQLWNILVGDMSFVGPRPLRPGEVEVRGNGQLVPLCEVPGYEERHRVRPGLTGLTQVYAPRDVTIVSKFRIDRLYMKNAGFWLDLKLILLSFWITACGAWEARDRRKSWTHARAGTNQRTAPGTRHSTQHTARSTRHP